MFTAWYGLGPYIPQISFVFKSLTFLETTLALPRCSQNFRSVYKLTFFNAFKYPNCCARCQVNFQFQGTQPPPPKKKPLLDRMVLTRSRHKTEQEYKLRHEQSGRTSGLSCKKREIHFRARVTLPPRVTCLLLRR